MSGLGRRGGSGRSGWQPVSIPSPSPGTCIKLVEGEGRHLFELRSLPSTSAQPGVASSSAPGQVWSPCLARLGVPTSLPTQPPEDGLGVACAGLSVPSEGLAQSG